MQMICRFSAVLSAQEIITDINTCLSWMNDLNSKLQESNHNDEKKQSPKKTEIWMQPFVP
ncbi:hypothetical protein Bhyg_14005 [Pseudolycoriella hygida]|uniref:Uncharacterized protein n=1 Tax=Pseudolycoriella hygida TaxID=35572 RepID=A0A9Q0MR60_9DIPT|nr:hypothetical protein Bhyg_14005 [Pseudolycoriella hygida]